MARSQEERKDAGLSATMLTGCLRQSYWQLTEDYYQRPSRLWPSVRGTLFHSLMETHPEPSCIHETRFGRTLPNGMVITGKMDKVNPVAGLVVDYKTHADIPTVLSERHIEQLNIYRWILRDGHVVIPGPVSTLVPGEITQFTIDRLGLIYLTMGEIRKVPVPTLPIEQTERIVQLRARQFTIAQHGGPVPDRIVPDPTKSALCMQWCPFKTKCLAVGA